MYNRFILHYLWNLRYVPNKYKTLEMYNKAGEVHSRLQEFIPNCYIDQIREIDVANYPWLLEYVTKSVFDLKNVRKNC